MNDMSASPSQGFSVPTSQASWSDLRSQTMAAHETPALFESIAGSADTDTDEHEDFESDDGRPVSAYATPLSLWEMKTGLLKPASAGRRGLWSRIKWGVIDSVVEDNGLERRKPAGVYLHPNIPFMSSRIDAEVSDDGGKTWMPLCAHNVANSIADGWRNASGEWIAPEHIVLQAHHHMAVTGADRFFVVALFGGTTIRTFTVKRDEALVADVLSAIRGFWKLVEENQRPDADFDRDGQILRRLCSKIDPATSVVDRRNDTELTSLIQEKNRLSARMSELNKEAERIKSLLAKKMEGVGVAIISDDRQLYWRRRAPQQVSYSTEESFSLAEKKISDKTAGTPIGDLLAAG